MKAMMNPQKGKGVIKGIYRRGQVFWFQPPMESGIRPRPFSLETTDETIANQKIIDYQQNPVTAEADIFMVEAERYFSWGREHDKLSESYVASCRPVFKAFAATTGVKNAARVTTRQIQDWYAGLKKGSSDKAPLKESTLQPYVFRLRGFFNWLRQEGRIAFNPADRVTMGNVVRHYRHRFCSKEEVDLLLQPSHQRPDGTFYQVPDDVRFVLLCGFEVGMRKNEISEAVPMWFATPGIVDLKNTDAYVFKDGEDRHVPLTDRFAAFLKTYGRPEPYMLASWKKTRGKSLYRYDFRRPFENHLEAVSVATGTDFRWVTAHTMRHSFASLRVQKGVSIYKVAKWLGDDVETVQKHYGHLAPNYDADIEV